MRGSTQKVPTKKTFLCYVDGDNEAWYLQMLKQNERLSNINIKPELQCSQKLSAQYNQIKQYLKIYDRVFWIIDLDSIIKETKERKNKSAKTPIETLHSYIEQFKDNQVNNIEIIINNPCLEYWYLLHFKKTSKYFEKYEELLAALKQEKDLSDYNKTEKYYKSKNNDIYKKLKPYLPQALINSQFKNNFTLSDNYQVGNSDMYKIFKEFELI
jgi:hypothetical protein